MSPLAKLLALLLVTTFMFETGLQTAPGSLTGMSRRLGELARGVLFLVVLGPLLAFVVMRAFDISGPVASSLVLLSIAGVAPLAPRGAKAVNGDIPLTVALMFGLDVLCIFTAPPTGRFLLGYGGPLDYEPGGLILKLVLLQGLPLALGLLLRSRFGHSPRLERTLIVLNTIGLVGILVLVLVPKLGSIADLGWRGLFATVTFTLVIAGLGYMLGGPTLAGRRSFLAIANMPNVGLSLAILASVPAAPPIVAATVVGMFLVRILIGIVLKVAVKRAQSHDVRGPTAADHPTLASP